MQKVTVCFQSDSEEESQFNLVRHKTPHPATLRDLDEKAKKVVDSLPSAHQRQSKTLASMMKDCEQVSRPGQGSKTRRRLSSNSW